MVMVTELIPGLKGFLSPLNLRPAALQMAMRLMITFMLHHGRMSCLQAAGAIRTDPRNRAQVGRLLQRGWFTGRSTTRDMLQRCLLEQEAGRGLFLFLIDATLVSQSGQKTENTYSAGNRQRRPRKGRRYGKQKHTPKTCHSFTCGVLITPSGVRIPFAIPHYTPTYCRRKGLTPRTTAQSAADLIRALPLPEGAEVIVLGDTAYDAKDVQQACADRGYQWIFPCNSERVYEGPKPRPKVRSRLKDWSSFSLQTIRFSPGQGKYAVYRRLSPHRIGPKAKPRTFYVHQESREVRSVGKVRLVFSTTRAELVKATADDVKILMTNALGLSVRDVVELYSLRWQIELFFKELKSTLGFHQYQFKDFQCVENWVQLALSTFLYLEWYRAKQLALHRLSDKDRAWWRAQRTHGLCQAIRAACGQAELTYIADRLKTPGGIAKLKRLIRNAFAPEYRAAG